LKVFLHHFSKDKKSKRNQGGFFLYLLNDRRIRIQSRIRIHTSDLWIRIQEDQKHVDPVDPDPQHWVFSLSKSAMKILKWLIKVPNIYSSTVKTRYGKMAGLRKNV
jgi:hypothetical protein